MQCSTLYVVISAVIGNGRDELVCSMVLFKILN